MKDEVAVYTSSTSLLHRPLHLYHHGNIIDFRRLKHHSSVFLNLWKKRTISGGIPIILKKFLRRIIVPFIFFRSFRLNRSRFGNSTIFGSLQIVLRRMVAKAVSAFVNSFRNFGIIYWQKISALNSIQYLYIFKTSLICKSYDWVLGGFTLFVM